MSKRSLSKTGLPAPVSASLGTLGRQLQRARRRKGLSKTRFAEQLQVHVDTVTRLEKGDPGLSAGILFTALWLLDALPAFDNAMAELTEPPAIRIDNDF